jgi:hypothetical protein
MNLRPMGPKLDPNTWKFWKNKKAISGDRLTTQDKFIAMDHLINEHSITIAETYKQAFLYQNQIDLALKILSTAVSTDTVNILKNLVDISILKFKRDFLEEQVAIETETGRYYKPCEPGPNTNKDINQI